MTRNHNSTGDQTKNLDSLCRRHIRHRQKGGTRKHLQADQQRLQRHQVHNGTRVEQQATIVRYINHQNRHRKTRDSSAQEADPHRSNSQLQ